MDATLALIRLCRMQAGRRTCVAGGFYLSWLLGEGKAALGVGEVKLLSGAYRQRKVTYCTVHFQTHC